MTVKYPANRPLTDEEEAEIQAMIASDPDAPELTDEELARMRPAREVMPPEFFEAIQRGREERRARGRPKAESPKQVLTIRLAPAAIAYFKSRGGNWRAKLQHDLEKMAGIEA